MSSLDTDLLDIQLHPERLTRDRLNRLLEDTQGYRNAVGGACDLLEEIDEIIAARKQQLGDLEHIRKKLEGIVADAPNVE